MVMNSGSIPLNDAFAHYSFFGMHIEESNLYGESRQY